MGSSTRAFNMVASWDPSVIGDGVGQRHANAVVKPVAFQGANVVPSPDACEPQSNVCIEAGELMDARDAWEYRMTVARLN